MIDWIEHNGGPQPVADDVWVEVEYPIIDPAADPLSDVPCYAIHIAGEHLWDEASHYRILNQHLIDTKQAEIDALQHEVMWLHNALEQTEDAVVYGYTLLDDMDALIDAARLDGIRLGLEAAAVEGTKWFGSLSYGAQEVLASIRALDPETIAREATLDQLTREAQAQGMGYDKENTR